MHAAGVGKIVMSSSRDVRHSGRATDLGAHAAAPDQSVWLHEVRNGTDGRRFRARVRAEVVALRYFNAAGADPDGEIGECHEPETHALPLAIRAALGTGRAFQVMGTDYPTPDGSAIRDYVHVSDLADAHLKATAYLCGGGTASH